MFTQVIIQKRNKDGQTKRTDGRRTDGRTDRHTDMQRETIIPRHSRVAGYKNYEPKAYKLCVSLKGCHIQLYQLPLVSILFYILRMKLANGFKKRCHLKIFFFYF